MSRTESNIMVRVSADEHRIMRDHAREMGTSMSDMMRDGARAQMADDLVRDALVELELRRPDNRRMAESKVPTADRGQQIKALIPALESCRKPPEALLRRMREWVKAGVEP